MNSIENMGKYCETHAWRSKHCQSSSQVSRETPHLSVNLSPPSVHVTFLFTYMPFEDDCHGPLHSCEWHPSRAAYNQSLTVVGFRKPSSCAWRCDKLESANRTSELPAGSGCDDTLPGITRLTNFSPFSVLLPLLLPMYPGSTILIHHLQLGTKSLSTGYKNPRFISFFCFSF